MALSISPCYTSVACGRSPHCVDWNTNGVICYGASHVVAIYDLTIRNEDSIATLYHHRGIVNAVKWIQNGMLHPTELISCSADKTAAVWSKQSDKWAVSVALEGHTDAVTCADGLYQSDSLLVFTGSVDSTVRVWERRNGIAKNTQTILLGSGLCLTLRATFVPGSNRPLLICALDDDKIYLFAESENSGASAYHKVAALIGHEDWVRGLDVMAPDPNSLLLASSSQDTYIRLWSIKRRVDESPASGIHIEEQLLDLYGESWSSKLEAVLAGHEHWVYGVHWHPPRIEADGTVTPMYKLLSSSLDKTLIVWEPEFPDGDEGCEGVWAERVRVGEVGGCGLGFYGGKFGPEGESFLGHGYNGSLHVWKFNEEIDQWEPSVVRGGHFGQVSDVRWEPRHGRYIASVSADQTTRIHAPWCDGGQVDWHEIARPQIHGFDLNSLALVSSTKFVSAADEKVIRAFQTPHNFVQNFKSITKMELVPDDISNGPEGASVPSLGLSNKAVFTGDKSDEKGGNKECDRYFVSTHLTEPPTEETLMQNTLWPEIQKLYGHGYEVFTLDASPDGTVVASACKATSAEHAAILLWDTAEWQQVQRLPTHQLTVTQLAFSPNSRHLVSVSRDRRWSLHTRRDGIQFELVAVSDKTNGVHARIIWCCAWTHDSLHFATGSRDGKVCVWGDVGNTKESSMGTYGLQAAPLEIAGESVTALAFAPVDVGSRRMLAVGFEKGSIQIYLLGTLWTLMLELDNSTAHHMTVSRLTFRPTCGTAGAHIDQSSQTLQLASCGQDHLVRIYNLDIADL